MSYPSPSADARVGTQRSCTEAPSMSIPYMVLTTMTNFTPRDADSDSGDGSATHDRRPLQTRRVIVPLNAGIASVYLRNHLQGLMGLPGCESALLGRTRARSPHLMETESQRDVARRALGNEKERREDEENVKEDKGSLLTSEDVTDGEEMELTRNGGTRSSGGHGSGTAGRNTTSARPAVSSVPAATRNAPQQSQTVSASDFTRVDFFNPHRAEDLLDAPRPHSGPSGDTRHSLNCHGDGHGNDDGSNRSNGSGSRLCGVAGSAGVATLPSAYSTNSVGEGECDSNDCSEAFHDDSDSVLGVERALRGGIRCQWRGHVETEAAQLFRAFWQSNKDRFLSDPSGVLTAVPPAALEASSRARAAADKVPDVAAAANEEEQQLLLPQQLNRNSGNGNSDRDSSSNSADASVSEDIDQLHNGNHTSDTTQNVKEDDSDSEDGETASSIAAATASMLAAAAAINQPATYALDNHLRGMPRLRAALAATRERRAATGLKRLPLGNELLAPMPPASSLASLGSAMALTADDVDMAEEHEALFGQTAVYRSDYIPVRCPPSVAPSNEDRFHVFASNDITHMPCFPFESLSPFVLVELAQYMVKRSVLGPNCAADLNVCEALGPPQDTRECKDAADQMARLELGIALMAGASFLQL